MVNTRVGTMLVKWVVVRDRVLLWTTARYSLWFESVLGPRLAKGEDKVMEVVRLRVRDRTGFGFCQHPCGNLEYVQ